MEKSRAAGPVGTLDAAKLFLLRRSWRVRCMLTMTVRIREAGRILAVPISRGTGITLATGDPSERELRETLRNVLSFRRGPVVDVGANVGVFLKCLVGIDPGIAYVAFEPDLSCAEFLARLIDVNGLSQHSVLPVGLGSRQAVATLSSNDAADVSATIVEGARPAAMYSRTEKVVVEKGDDLLQAYFGDQRIALIKVDVEDGESLVVAGLRKTIEQHRPFLMLEVCPYQHFVDGKIKESYYGAASRDEMMAIAERRRQLVQDLDASLTRHGYRSMKIHHDGSVTPVATVDPGEDRNVIEINYLAVPQEEYSGFLTSL